MGRPESFVSKVTLPGTCYLVGGAVRDELLGLKAHERDWVVVGADKQAMLDAGFKQVGKAYPVFLHPETFQEYALARTETKIGPGHGGFEFRSNPSVALEQDLRRRDLTINAIAKSDVGDLIDPYGGQHDLVIRTLRHVSDAFTEDPLRCLRVARFAAMLPSFSVYPATLELIRSMQDQLHELSAERVWNEWIKALGAPAPHRFYDVLRQADIECPWFECLDLASLSRCHENRAIPLPGAFALLGWLHDETELEQHFDLLKAPNKARVLAMQVMHYGRLFACEVIRNLDSQMLLEILTRTNALHGDTRFDNFLAALDCVADIDASWIQDLRNRLRAVKVAGEPGPELGEAIKERRLATIDAFLKERLQ